MIRDICKDELFLARKAAPALPEDLPIAQDLLETLLASGVSADEILEKLK